MESIVFFGKGGIGKSTLASNVSALLAAGGGSVLHIGCDPKMDSTLSLMGRHIQPFSDSPGPDPETRLREFIFDAPVKGVRCIEVGGPRPGLGCAGTGIGVMLDAVKDSGLLEKDGYTATVFD
ncbi:MAG TPA: AAA family ATPase, partial [Elusimicrobiales bacterium]|nr:AAA family ATPase [Elusimicrobiales bacterium]